MKFIHIVWMFPLFFALGAERAIGDEDCREMPTAVCVLDMARGYLDGFSLATEPPQSSQWTEDMVQYPELDVRSEAWRITRDTYASVAKGYAKIGEGPKSQETLDAIGSNKELASRYADVVGSNPNAFDKSWLNRTLPVVVNAVFPFELPSDNFESDSWEGLLDLSRSLGRMDIIAEQERRLEELTATKSFEQLPPELRDQAIVSILKTALLREDFAKAEQSLKEISTPWEQDTGKILIGEALAFRGETEKAFALIKGVDVDRISGVHSAAAIYWGTQGDLERARDLLSNLDDYARSFALEKLAVGGHVSSAEKLSGMLELGWQARLQVMILRIQISDGDLEAATRTADRIEEVGERAVAWAVLALSAAKKGRADLVERAQQEIDAMERYNVDLVQIADSQVAILFAHAILPQAISPLALSEKARKHVVRIDGEAFPDDPVAALGANEARARLLIRLAGAQFALGLMTEAQASLADVEKIGSSGDPGETAFILAEAAGTAYGLCGPGPGVPAVKLALAKAALLKYPMDQAMILSHLAEMMLQ